MTMVDFARSVIENPGYADSIVARAKAGTLPVEIEMFLLETFELAGGSRLRTAGAAGAAPAQGPSFALLRRPPAFTDEETSHD